MPCPPAATSSFVRGYHPVAAGQTVWLLRLSGNLVYQPATQAPPGWLQAEVASTLHEQLPVLGLWQQKPVLLQLLPAAQTNLTDWQPLRSCLLQAGHEAFELLGMAAGLAHWLEANPLCSSCGQKLGQQLSPLYHRLCTGCQRTHYPQVAPCIITLVWKDDYLLLARGQKTPPGLFTTLAGFIEPGENAEQAIVREVMEEVGVSVGYSCYQRSQAWPFPHSLMLGYWSEYASGEITPDKDEIIEADWFHWQQLPALPPPSALSRQLIDTFVAWRRSLAASN